MGQGKMHTVIGLGTSGMAAVRYLHGRGHEVSVSECRPPEQLTPDELDFLRKYAVVFEAGGHSWDFIRKADLIVPSPGVPLNLPVLDKARKHGIGIVGELALAAGQIDVPVIAVTGSNGKTTVTSLIGHLLKRSASGPW